MRRRSDCRRVGCRLLDTIVVPLSSVPGFTQPAGIKNPNSPPVYPADAQRAGQASKVIVRVYVGIDGYPTRAEIRTSSGHQALDDSARDAVMSRRYRPGMINGVPEALWYSVPVIFSAG